MQTADMGTARVENDVKLNSLRSEWREIIRIRVQKYEMALPYLEIVRSNESPERIVHFDL